MSHLLSERFGKKYKLCSKKIIDSLFEEKNTIKVYPLYGFYKFTELPSDSPLQVMISVPKRYFRKAHDRNYVKRKLREVFRKKKVILEEELMLHQKQLALAIVFSSKEDLSYIVLDQKIEILLTKLKEEFLKTTKVEQ
jgi:ribonuclease P protein component